MTPALRVEDLSIDLTVRGSSRRLVHDVSFEIAAGARLGLVGESGSGKSLTALAIMRLLRPPVGISSGRMLLHDGVDLAALDEPSLVDARGRRMAMVYQDPMSALNPVKRIGDQIAEAIRCHGQVTAKNARRRAVELLGEVGISDPHRRSDQFPHEFSGGMRQRVVIAMALSSEPELIVADEPTTALDVSTQAVILDLLNDVTEQRGTAVMLITHDLGVAAQFCDDLHVMYAGRLVEKGDLAGIFESPAHPYSAGLLGSICRLDTDVALPLTTMPGHPPVAGTEVDGCSFRPRCRDAVPQCAIERPLLELTMGERLVACHVARGCSGTSERGTSSD